MFFDFIIKSWDGNLSTIDQSYKPSPQNQDPRKKFLAQHSVKTAGQKVVEGQNRNKVLLEILDGLREEWTSHSIAEQSAVIQKLSISKTGAAQSLREKVTNFISEHKILEPAGQRARVIINNFMHLPLPAKLPTLPPMEEQPVAEATPVRVDPSLRQQQPATAIPAQAIMPLPAQLNLQQKPAEAMPVRVDIPVPVHPNLQQQTVAQAAQATMSLPAQLNLQQKPAEATPVRVDIPVSVLPNLQQQTVTQAAQALVVKPESIEIPWAGWTITIDADGALWLPDELTKNVSDEAFSGILSCMHPDIKAKIKTVYLSAYPHLTHKACTECLEHLPNVRDYSDIAGIERFFNAEIRFANLMIGIRICLKLFADPQKPEHTPKAKLNDRHMLILDVAQLPQIFERMVSTYPLTFESQFTSGLKLKQLEFFKQLGKDYFNWFSISDGILRFIPEACPFIDDDHLLAILEQVNRAEVRDIALVGTQVTPQGKKAAQILLPSLMKEFEPMIHSWIFTLDGRDNKDEDRKIIRPKVKELDVSKYELTAARLTHIKKRYPNLTRLITATGEINPHAS